MDITTHPGTPEERTCTVNSQANGEVHKIDIPDDEDIHFEYEEAKQAKLLLLAIVKYSTGAMEEMQYDLNGLKLPSNAPIDFTPAITKHTKTIASDMPPITTRYSYPKGDEGKPGRNYWGCYSGIDWNDNTDTLANYKGIYRYSSTEIMLNLTNTTGP